MTPVPGAAGVDARLVVRRPGFELDVPLAVAPGETVALLGPNGAGKSTALRAMAGLTPLHAGHLDVAGRRVEGGGTRVPAHRRGVGVVFQDGLLFGHLDVLDNVAFGPRMAGVPRRIARDTALQWLRRLGVEHLAPARPATLSGGEAQRVALARALASDPVLLLLDEPMSALDAGTRIGVRHLLAEHLGSLRIPTVLVTHDVVDAMVLADRVLVIEDGRAVQQGPPEDLARAPRTDYVARLVGLNLFRGNAVVTPGGGTTVSVSGGGELRTVGDHVGPVVLVVRPQAVSMHRDRPTGSIRNVWPGTVAGLEPVTGAVRVRVHATPTVSADVTPQAAAELGLVPGVRVWVAVKATDVAVHPD